MRRKSHILVVEDSPAQAIKLQYLLEQSGFIVTVAVNGTDALKKIREVRPTLVVSDVIMPDMDGYILCRTIKEDPVLKKIPVILLTYLAEPENVVKGLEAGADNFIMKPYEADHLLHRIQDILDTSEIRLREKTREGIHFRYGGKTYLVQSANEQILDLLISTFEHSVNQHRQLIIAKEELTVLNKNLAKRTKELQISEYNYRALLDSNADGIVVTDISCIVKFVNKSAEELLGQKREELIGNRFLFELSSGAITETEIMRIDGSSVVIETRVVDSSWEGEPALLASIRDITLRKEEEKRLRMARNAAEQATQAKSLFLANMSHEIRTPLNGLLGMMSLLNDTNLTLEQKEYVDFIRSSGDSLLAIINDLLDYSKIEAGKLAFETIDFDLYNAIEASFDIIADQAEAKGLELVSYISPAIFSQVRGDPHRLRQVLVNLLNNAVKFTDHGEISVEVEQVNEAPSFITLRFSIRDTGIGISPDAQERIFDSFSQADVSIARKYGGTGLGLAISKKLVEAMGGTLNLSSEPGKGSTFWFYASFQKQLTEPTARLDNRFCGIHACVLVANETNLKLTGKKLKGLGVCTDLVTDRDQLFLRMDSRRKEGKQYDIVFIDQSLHIEKGSDLVALLQRNSSFSGIPFVLMGSHRERGNLQKEGCLESILFLSKPLKHSALLTCLQMIRRDDSVPAQEEAIEAYDDNGLRLGMSDVLLNVWKDVRVLVVEDNQINQRVAMGLLRKLGCEVEGVSTGLRALEEVKSKQYDLVFMDCQLPDMEGSEVTQLIRSIDERSTTIPIVALTAYSMTEDRERCIAAGMNDYLSKPITIEKLASILAQWAPEKKLSDITGRNESEDEDFPEGIDFSILNDLRKLMANEEPFFVPNMIKEFLITANDKLNKIAHAYRENDVNAIARLIHSLIGVSANLGFVRLSRIAQKLENCTASETKDGFPEILGELEAEVERIQPFLDEYSIYEDTIED